MMIRTAAIRTTHPVILGYLKSPPIVRNPGPANESCELFLTADRPGCGTADVVAAGTPGSLKLYIPSGGGPTASAGLAVPRATSVMTAGAVRPREVLIFRATFRLGVDEYFSAPAPTPPVQRF